MIGYDTETHLIRRGRLTPPAVCLTLAGTGEAPAWVPPASRLAVGAGWCALLDRAGLVEAAVPLLQSGVVVAHNAPFDLGVIVAAHQALTGTDEAIAAAMEALHEGRAPCTQIRERLIRIAHGELEWSLTREGVRPTRYDLAGLVLRYLGVDIDSDKTDPDAWRLRYAELDGVPVASWPARAVTYAVMDAVFAVQVYEAQAARYEGAAFAGHPLVVPGTSRIVAEDREHAAAWALHLMATWGLRTEPAAVESTLAAWRAGSEAGRELARAEGWVRPNGTGNKKALQAAVEAAYEARGAAPPRTAPSKTFASGQVKTSEETLTESGDPKLARYAESLHFTNWLSKYAEPLQMGLVHPVTSRPNVLVETGRTSWSDPPLQQPPREGGYREAHVPRRGWLYCSVDYDTIELCALAQVCVWIGAGRAMADAINSGRDLHILTALELLRLAGRSFTYDEAMARYKAGDPAVGDARQAAKALNFGLPGGLGTNGLVAYARSGYGVEIPPAQAEQMISAWQAAYPEMRGYFAWVDGLMHDDAVVHPVSGRIRGAPRYTAACNGFFQGLVADGAKYAAWLLAQASYTGRVLGVPELAEAARTLHGRCRPVLFLHDEILTEIPEDGAHEVAEAQAEVMRFAMRKHIPDVRIGADPALMRRWFKGAKTLRDEAGRLQIWEPAS